MPPLALIPLLAPLVPGLVRVLAGDRAGDVAAQVSDTVAAIAGSDTPEAVAAAIADPERRAELHLALARIEAEAERETMRAMLADVASARAQTVDLARAGSPMAYGAAIVSVIVLVAFGGAMWIAMFKPIPERSEAILNILLGTLAAMATSVVSYWVGSSAGSARKDAALRDALPGKPR